MSTREALYSLIEGAFNRWVRLDPEALPRLAPLYARVIHIRVLGLGMELYAVPGPDGVHIYPALEGPADCTLSGTPFALARLGHADRGQDELFSGRVRIEGDTDLGHRFGEILAQVDIDWTEYASRVVGDIPAQAADARLRDGADWLRRAGGTLRQDLAEYLQEEAGLTPPRLEVEEFYSRVDDLRDAVERLEARVRRLQASEDDAES